MKLVEVVELRLGPEGAQSLVRAAGYSPQGQARSAATRRSGKKGGLTPEQRWEMAVQAGVRIVLDYLRREGKRIA